MRVGRLIAAAAGAFLLAATAVAQQVPAYVSAALADAARPDADKARDVDRKPAQVTVLTGVKPGDKVADIYPGSGYYTRIFAKAVGPKGHVYMLIPEEAATRAKPPADALAAEYPNVSVIVTKMAVFKSPEPLDVVFNSEFYHDMFNPRYGGPDIDSQNKAILAALKPGGRYFVIDHSSVAGTGLADIGTIHRIDEAEALKTLTASGFKLDAKSDLLRNPADDRKKLVFDASIRGKTDQFILKMVKAKR